MSARESRNTFASRVFHAKTSCSQVYCYFCIDSFDVVAWFCLSRVQSQGRATRNWKPAEVSCAVICMWHVLLAFAQRCQSSNITVGGVRGFAKMVNECEVLFERPLQRRPRISRSYKKPAWKVWLPLGQGRLH